MVYKCMRSTNPIDPFMVTKILCNFSEQSDYKHSFKTCHKYYAYSYSSFIIFCNYFNYVKVIWKRFEIEIAVIIFLQVLQFQVAK